MVRFDRLIKVDRRYFMASRIISFEVSTNPLAVAIDLEGGQQITLTEGTDIQSFRDQFTEFLKKNGILQWGDL